MMGILNVILATSGSCSGSSSLNAVVFAEGFGATPIGALPPEWISAPTTNTWQWEVRNSGYCGGLAISGRGACVEAFYPSATNLSEDLITDTIPTPPLSPSQNAYLKYYYQVGFGNWSVLDVFMKTCSTFPCSDPGNWSGPIFLTNHITNNSPNLINITSHMSGSRKFLLIFRARAVVKDTDGVEITGAFLDSLIVFTMDSSDTVGGGDPPTPCDTCCILVSTTGLVINAPRRWPWWFPPYSLNNRIRLCNMGCEDSTEYTVLGRLYVNGVLRHSGTYTIPPGSCQTISWPVLRLKFGYNTASFVLTPMNNGCSSYRFNTSFYVFKRKWPWSSFTALAGPIDLSEIFSDHPCKDFPSLCRLPASEGIRVRWTELPDTLRSFTLGGLIMGLGDTTLAEGERVSGTVFLYPSTGDTIEVAFDEAIRVDSLGIRYVPILEILEKLSKRSYTSVGDMLPLTIEVYFDNPMKPFILPIPSEKDVRILTGSSWIDPREMNVVGDIAVHLILSDPSIIDVEERVITPDRRVMYDGKRLQVTGSGELRIYSSDGRLLARSKVKNGEGIPVSHLPKGIYFYTFGEERGKFIKW
ncbi:MAG: T9SS type A sorting domain-containing protein [Thermotogae bacterium]|nr:T9SS type A sorting domain-containing protein [Thermotogota bacterium]